jgi:hypothetical protein
MKSMAALRQKSKSLIFLKLVQANRALCSFNYTFAAFILAHRDGTDDRGLKTDGADVPDRMVHHRTIIFVKKLVVGRLRLALQRQRPA